MSLSRAILRIITVQCLRGHTLAEDRVFDSDLDPLDHRISSQKKPVAVVYTDDQQEDVGDRADMGQGAGSIDLVIEIAIAGSVVFDGVDESESAVEVTVGESDAGMELTLDLLERQAIAALTTATGEWPNLWRVFCVRILRRVSKRGGSAENGSRFAARQIVLTCQA